jgi:hypothetical protein
MTVACRSTHSGESWRSEVPAVSALFGMDYLQFRFVGGPNAVGPRHLRDDPLQPGEHAIMIAEYPIYRVPHFSRALCARSGDFRWTRERLP